MTMKWICRGWLPVLCVAAVLLVLVAGGGAETSPYGVSLTIDPGKKLGPANRRLLGNNIQWPNGGDGVLAANGAELDQRLVNEMIRPLGATVLRFPGGVFSDTYHWRDGMGPLEARGQNDLAFSRSQQKVLMGTQEFLELCEALGAEPLITVNVVTGTAQEAADWVRLVNVQGLVSRLTGKRLPRVDYWEIGNEPYLKLEGREDLWVPPADYARRADSFIALMRSIDPAIKVGIPLRSDTIGGIPAVHYPGFNDTVLSSLKAVFDFAALHNAYMPLVIDGQGKDEQLFLATAAASEEVKKDLAATRAQLARHRPGQKILLAITEYNALFGFPGQPFERYLATPGGAFFVADLLCMLAGEPDILTADFWSLSDNWYFGAVKNLGAGRPAYPILKEFSALLRGEQVETRLTTAGGVSLQTPPVGLVPAQSALPPLVARAVSDNGQIRGVLVNRHPSRPAKVTFAVAGGAGSPLRLHVASYSSAAPFPAGDVAASFTVDQRDVAVGANGQDLVVAPRAVSFYQEVSSGEVAGETKLKTMTIQGR